MINNNIEARKSTVSLKVKKEKKAAEGFEVVDWLSNHPQTKRHASLPQTQEVQHFINSFWPMTTDYFNPFNEIFLVRVLALELLNARDKWFVRDGIVPLLWFFKRFPQPRQLQAKLYVDIRWAYFIPKAWQKHVYFYELVSFSEERNFTKSFLFGTLMSQILSKETIKEKRALAEEEGAGGLKGVEAFLLTRSSMNNDEQSFHVGATFEVARQFGLDIRPLNWAQFLDLNSFQGCYAIDFNSAKIVSDNYLYHLILSKGGYVQGVRCVSKLAKSDIQLSPFHGFVITKKPSKTKSLVNNKENLFKILNSEANLKLPWPTWFGDWKPESKK